MSTNRLIAFVSLFALVGCATMPPGPNPTVVERDIVESVLRELCSAVIDINLAKDAGNPYAQNEYFSRNEGWIALIETSLRTDVEGAVSPTATLLGPIIPGAILPKGGGTGSYTALAAAIFDQTATTLRDGKRYVVLNNLMKDTTLCPQPGTETFLAYHPDGIHYVNNRKYLAGTLGIHDWLWESVYAQDFGPVVSPTTIIGEGPWQTDSVQQHNVHTAIQKSAALQRFSAQRSSAEFKAAILNLSKVEGVPQTLDQKAAAEAAAVQCESAIKVTQQTVSFNWVQGQVIPTQPVQLPFVFSCPFTTRVTGPTPALNGLSPKPDDKTGTLVFGPLVNPPTAVPSSANGQYSFTVTAHATNQQPAVPDASVTFIINVAPAPKATSWGSIYAVTFTFVIKATGQLAPAFTFDRSKAGSGSSSLFSMSRTETNYVNIVLTPVGVPLATIDNKPVIQTDANGKLVSTRPANNLPQGSVDLVDKAMLRLDNTLLKLNNAQIGIGNLP